MKTSITAFFALCEFQNLILSQNNWLNYTNNKNIIDMEEVYYYRRNSEISSNFLIDIIALPNDDLWFPSNLSICLFSNGTFYETPKEIKWN